MSESDLFPELPLQEWKATKETLHRYLQIIGKLRLSLMPKRNHWWHLTLYVNSLGITTYAIPYKNMTFEVQFDFIDHKLKVFTSTGEMRSFELIDGLSVADFYHKFSKIMEDLNIEFNIVPKPYDLSDDIPFYDCTQHASYDRNAIKKAWKILINVDMVFKEFSGRSYCKTCPVHIYWHHFDLTVTRFSGREAPEMDTTSIVEKEAYSHEVISFGFWFGDETVQEPAFYSYTYPSPEDLEKEPLQPDTAKWIDANGSPMALLFYKDIRNADHPKKRILDFLESSYQAGAKLANWNIEKLNVG